MLRCLSLTQPWASLVMFGFKRIETRSWATGYAGPLGIHAAKGFPGWARGVCYEQPFAYCLQRIGITQPDDLPFGSVLGIVTLKQCVSSDRYPLPAPGSLERAFGDFGPGRSLWLLDDIEAFEEPIPARGKPGLWEWDLPDPELLRTRPVVQPAAI